MIQIGLVVPEIWPSIVKSWGARLFKQVRLFGEIRYACCIVPTDLIYTAVFSGKERLAMYKMRFSVIEQTVANITLHKEVGMEKKHFSIPLNLSLEPDHSIYRNTYIVRIDEQFTLILMDTAGHMIMWTAPSKDLVAMAMAS